MNSSPQPPSTPNNKALAGINVLDLSRILAGPYAGQVLGDLGANVIKIEKPGSGDDTRSWGPPFIETEGRKNASYFYSANRNKRSLALDLKKADDIKFLHHLVSQADVIIENFKTGGAEKLGLDYASLNKKNPRLIYCSISGFGRTGPYKDRMGYDALIQAMGGLMSITGPENSPSRVGVAITDITTGLYAVIGILAAIHHRQNSGVGQRIDLSLFATQVSWLANVGMNYLVSQKTPKAYGTAHPNIVPYQAFDCQNGKVYIAVGNDSQFEKLCNALEQAWHLDPKWSSNEARVKNRDQLLKELTTIIHVASKEELIKKLHQHEVPCGPINSVADLEKDPQVIFSELFTKMSDSEVPCLKSPLELSKTPIKEYRTPAHQPSDQKIDFNCKLWTHR